MLSGDAVEDQSAVLKEATETKNYAAIHVIHTCLLRLACFFGNWEMALQHVMAVENNIRMLQCVPGSYMYTEYLFFSGLTHIIQAQRATHFGRKGYGKHLRKAKRILKTLDKYVGEGTLDCLPYCLLLDAEVMYFDFMIRKRNLPNVMCAFDKAIAVCKEIDASHIHALASERLGLVLHNLGEEKRAITCFLEAQKMYHKWQAYAKIEPLDEMIANAISGTVVTMQTM
jgi:tetratricopeptide (TPR) repeat protein